MLLQYKQMKKKTYDNNTYTIKNKTIPLFRDIVH